MKNYEVYEKEILELANKRKSFGVVNDKIVDCDGISCRECDLSGMCNINAIKWLYAEHVEKPKINKRTKMFFEAIKTGWVARDESGGLYLYGRSNKPVKRTVAWASTDIRFDNSIVPLGVFPFLTLDFIKWEDEEPWKVEDILKLEVEG